MAKKSQTQKVIDAMEADLQTKTREIEALQHAIDKLKAVNGSTGKKAVAS